jgi:hypothetical protein
MGMVTPVLRWGIMESVRFGTSVPKLVETLKLTVIDAEV